VRNYGKEHSFSYWFKTSSVRQQQIYHYAMENRLTNLKHIVVVER